VRSALPFKERGQTADWQEGRKGTLSSSCDGRRGQSLADGAPLPAGRSGRSAFPPTFSLLRFHLDYFWCLEGVLHFTKSAKVPLGLRPQGCRPNCLVFPTAWCSPPPPCHAPSLLPASTNDIITPSGALSAATYIQRPVQGNA
jgi:hypothetical protein